MRTHHEPDDLTPDQRRAALAALLARGVLRLLRRPPQAAAGESRESLKTGGNPLEVPAGTRLSVPTG